MIAGKLDTPGWAPCFQWRSVSAEVVTAQKRAQQRARATVPDYASERPLGWVRRGHRLPESLPSYCRRTKMIRAHTY